MKQIILGNFGDVPHSLEYTFEDLLPSLHEQCHFCFDGYVFRHSHGRVSLLDKHCDVRSPLPGELIHTEGGRLMYDSSGRFFKARESSTSWATQLAFVSGKVDGVRHVVSHSTETHSLDFTLDIYAPVDRNNMRRSEANRLLKGVSFVPKAIDGLNCPFDRFCLYQDARFYFDTISGRGHEEQEVYAIVEPSRYFFDRNIRSTSLGSHLINEDTRFLVHGDASGSHVLTATALDCSQAWRTAEYFCSHSEFLDYTSGVLGSSLNIQLIPSYHKVDRVGRTGAYVAKLPYASVYAEIPYFDKRGNVKETTRYYFGMPLYIDPTTLSYALLFSSDSMQDNYVYPFVVEIPTV